MSRVELINFSDFVNVLSSTNPLEVNYLHIHIASRSAILRQSFFFFKSSKNRLDVKNVFKRESLKRFLGSVLQENQLLLYFMSK